MKINQDKARQYLHNFNFEQLFLEEIGWNHSGESFNLLIDEEQFQLEGICEKRQVFVFVCEKSSIPEYSTRRKIDRGLAKIHREHLIIYVDSDHTRQIWQWVRREPGKPLASREHHFSTHQSGRSLLQKLEQIAVNLEEEEKLNLIEVTGRLRMAFDKLEATTRDFYSHFQTERKTFEKFIEGIESIEAKREYVSIMLNRLMFCYFIQKQGFLDGDTNYLSNKLQMMQERFGEDKFYSFYRYFLRRLFLEGLGMPDYSQRLEQLIGRVPFLNGGLFEIHRIERVNPNIQIPDKAFERILEFFNQYDWHLDERPLRNDNEINPDILGFIFEKYINQKELGAFYTAEDLTSYISRNTIIPYIFRQVEKDIPEAFEKNSFIWKLLQENPDRYIFPALRKGINHSDEIPKDIQDAISNPSKREYWNKPTPSEFGLLDEIWRETISRWQQYNSIKSEIINGNVDEINKIITLNLDLEQFVLDVIQNNNNPELINSLWSVLSTITILDPACGSGAFLFAALNILEPLYDSCLDQMQRFLIDDEELEEGIKRQFTESLERIEEHPNRAYFILKSIVVNNLYGVDIVPEATEIAKLRLFLKLIAQITSVDEIEPLPDIDFNIRDGNSLVGFSSLNEVKDAIKKASSGSKKNRQVAQEKLIILPEEEEALRRINQKAAEVNEIYHNYQNLQIAQFDETLQERHKVIKDMLHDKLDDLNRELDRTLATLHNVDIESPEDYQEWLEIYKPFHWFSEFFGIIHNNGFNIIIENPPFLEMRQVDYTPIGYESLSGPIHSMFVERSLSLVRETGSLSMVMPMAIVCTQRMGHLVKMLAENSDVWYSNYSWRPDKLFNQVNRALTIFVRHPSSNPETFTTDYQKWYADSRSLLLEQLKYVKLPVPRVDHWVPKIGHEIEKSILKRFLAIKSHLGTYMANGSGEVFYRTTGGLYWKVFTDYAPKFLVNGKKGHSSRENSFNVNDKKTAKIVVALLSSDLFWWWYTISSTLRDLNPYDIQNFPVPKSVFDDSDLIDLGKELIDDMEENSEMLTRRQRNTGLTQTQSFKVIHSKSILDRIDKQLSGHYKLTEEELDFLINYDIKFRMKDEIFDD